MSALYVPWLQGIQCLQEEAQGAHLGDDEGHWIQFQQILCEKQEMCDREVIVNDKVLKSENNLTTPGRPSESPEDIS